MISSIFKLFLIFLQISKLVHSKQIAAYWGQSSSQESLGSYCEQGNLEIVIISFVNDFTGDSLSFNFGNACDSSTSCDSIADDINKCQSLGVKVLLSLGGSIGDYSLTDVEATNFASLLFQKFGPDGTVFPGALIDGFDLDIENGAASGYTKLTTKLKKKFANSKSNAKQILISAAPQCVYPDAYLNDVLANGDIDYAFIQFYNNYCNLNSADSFNWDTWLNAATTEFQNKDMQLFIGLPGSSDSASSGYATIDTVREQTKNIIDESKFGGFMVWDVNYATKNDNYLNQLKQILSQTSTTSSSSSASNSATVASYSTLESLGSTTLGSESIKTEVIQTKTDLTTTATITGDVLTAYETLGGDTTTLYVSSLQSTLHTVFATGDAATLTTTATVYASDISSSSSTNQIFNSQQISDIISNTRTTQTLQPSSDSANGVTKITSTITTHEAKNFSTTVYMATTSTTAITITDDAETASDLQSTATLDIESTSTISSMMRYVTAVQELDNGHVVVILSS